MDNVAHLRHRPVLLTGATGLLGKQLLAQLLSLDRLDEALPQRPPAPIFVLLRRRGAADASYRMQREVLASPVFAELRQTEQWKAAIGRLVPLTVDLAQPADAMGLDTEQWRRLRSEVQVVLHCARSSSTEKTNGHTNGSSACALFQSLAVGGAATCFVNCLCCLAPTLLTPLPLLLLQQLDEALLADPLGESAHELLVASQVPCVDLALQALGERQLRQAILNTSAEWSGAAASVRLGLLAPPKSNNNNSSSSDRSPKLHSAELVELQLCASRLALQSDEQILLVPCDMAARMVLLTAGWLLGTPKGQGLQLTEYTHSTANPLLWGRVIRALQRRQLTAPGGVYGEPTAARALRFRPLAGVAAGDEHVEALWEAQAGGDLCRLDQLDWATYMRRAFGPTLIELGDPAGWTSRTVLAQWGRWTGRVQRARLDFEWVRNMHMQAVPGASYRSNQRMSELEQLLIDRMQAEGLEVADEELVRNLIRDMVGGPKRPAVSLTAYLLRKVWRRLFDSITAEVDALETVRAAVAEPGTPVVLLPTHRSFADFLIVSYLMYAIGLPLPSVAAKDDMAKMGPLSLLLRNTGAFFLRRGARRDDDELYQAVFATYVEHLVSSAPVFEFYIEGARSRDGKMMPPKTGLLALVCACFFKSLVKDVLFVPIAISYEKVPEPLGLLVGNASPSDLMGLMLHHLQQGCGQVRVKVLPPISLKSFCEDRSVPLTASAAQVKEEGGEHWRLVEDLACTVVGNLAHASVVMPAALLASAFLINQADEMSSVAVSRLAATMQQLKIELERRACSNSVIEGNCSVHRGLSMLHGALRCSEAEVDGLVSPLRGSNTQLNYYRNTLFHWFVADVLTLVAFWSCGNRARPSEGEDLATLQEALKDVRLLLHRWFAFWMPNKSSTERTQLLSSPDLVATGCDALKQCGAMCCTEEGRWQMESSSGHWLVLLVQSMMAEQMGALLLVAVGLLQLCGSRRQVSRGTFNDSCLRLGQQMYTAAELRQQGSCTSSLIEDALEVLSQPALGLVCVDGTELHAVAEQAVQQASVSSWIHKIAQIYTCGIHPTLAEYAECRWEQLETRFAEVVVPARL